MASSLLLTHTTHADPSSLAQTKIKLKQLDFKINHLQHSLSSAQDKTSILSDELAHTEKKISLSVRELRHIQQNIAQAQQKISQLEQQIILLRTQLQTQQSLLAQHVRARYTMGEYQPLKWLLNQDNPSTTSRLMTFYQYVIQSRQQIIQHVKATQNHLTQNQQLLHQEVIAQHHLQQELNQHQQKLEHQKLYSTAIIQTLNKDIHNQQQTLNEYQQNKNDLSGLLKSLMQQNLSQTQRPFMYAKLPKPVNAPGHKLEKISQGIVFFAREGTPVTAVYSGKVVFSDWLKGYGLLLIIDHGRGFMTLYAHNQSLFKQKGDLAVSGEQIATVGHSGGIKQNGLYFEIRRQGKAIPPLAWLS